MIARGDAGVNDIAESITLAVTAKANALKKVGVDVVSFGAGEPDFGTPGFIKEAAIKALLAGKTKYEPTPGTVEGATSRGRATHAFGPWRSEWRVVFAALVCV